MSSTNGIGRLLGSINTIATSEVSSSKQTNTAHSTTRAANTNATSSDQASLSSDSSIIAQALSGDDVRADKVATLREAISSGSYNVSSGDVADKLISSLLK